MKKTVLLILLVASIAVPARAEVGTELTIQGPAHYRGGYPVEVSGSFRLNAELANVGLPGQTIILVVDGIQRASTQTSDSGDFSFRLTFRKAGQTHELQAVAYRSTPAELRSNVLTMGPLEPTWTQRDVAGPPPGYHAGAAFDRVRGHVVQFGGGQEAGTSYPANDETWLWDGTQWTQAHPPVSPPARVHPAMAFSAATGTTIMFGGHTTAFENLADTWSWDGTTWSRLITASSPPARTFHSMTYDPRRRVIVLFGGDAAGTPLGDTWEFDGEDWTQVSSSGPSARMSYTSAFDGRGVVIFGGWDRGTIFDDAWRWDGETWTQLPQDGPAGRIDAAAAFDSRRRLMVVTGGVRAGLVDETWTWNGETWQQLIAATRPDPRGVPTLTYDSKRDEFVLVGGYRDPPDDRLGDTWTLTLP